MLLEWLLRRTMPATKKELTTDAIASIACAGTLLVHYPFSLTIGSDFGLTVDLVRQACLVAITQKLFPA
ncbi:MAG: hypothetical protein WKF60_10035, partial [Ilumatobacter sp.]